ncbi:MAG: DUF1580 domain-containing protein [Pirellulaceae bacterium]
MADGILGESRLTLSQAARYIGVHAATAHRWRLRGTRGCRLETILVGGIRYTSREALERFVAATTAAADGTAVPARTSAQRERAIAAAERELADAGI